MYEGFDLSQYVSVLSVTFLAVTCFLASTVPFVAIYLFRKKFRAEYKALFYGVADYLSLEYMLCRIAWLLLLLIPVFQTSSAAYIIVGLILASIIMEGGRYFIIGLMKKQEISFGGLFLFAAGVFAANSLINVLVQAFQSFVIAMTINDTGLDVLVQEAGENALAMLQSVEPMLTCSPYIYLMTGLDLFVNLLFHISVTVLLYAVYTGRLQKYYLAAVMGLRFIYELPGYCYSYKIFITNAFLAEAISVVIAAAAAYLAYHVLTVEMPDELGSLTRKEEKAPFPDFNANIRKDSIRKNANILAGKNDEESDISQ